MDRKNRDRRWELFECERCGICCTGIELPYDPESILEIANFLGLTPEETFGKYYGRISSDGKSWEFDEAKRNPCPFLIIHDDGKTSCYIQTVKPNGCKLYPFDSSGTLDCPVARKVIEIIRKENPE
ncbi:MAG: YkgJ family cysteine cluster protein [Syntrophales bacterium]